MAQDIADFDAGTGRVKTRSRTLVSAGTHMSMPDEDPCQRRQWWEGGLYENEYIKEDGLWKILRLRYYPFWHGRFAEGWQYCTKFVPSFTETYPASESAPDELCPHEQLWPDTRVVPFHYPHPVTGREVAEADMKGPQMGRKQ